MMPDRIRQSLAFVIAIGMVIAVASAPTVAQVADPNAERVFEAAGLNVDRVDGRHATKYTSNKKKRAGKLVATNAAGYLPGNIVKPKWRLIQNKPAGFADGVDNVGAVFTTYLDPGTYSVGAQSISLRITEPQGVVTNVRLRPISLNDEVVITEETYKRASSYELIRYFRVERHPSSPSAVVQFRVRVWAVGPSLGPAAMTPAALKKALKRSIEVSVVKRR